MNADTEFAVLDVETTGLFPGGSDRIVEIAAVRIDPAGKVLDQYTTLVNPLRDIGPTHVHGLTARDVRHAPAFEEIAGDVIARLAGAVIVGHNVSFDTRFLYSEMSRAGCDIPRFPSLCTMHLARRMDPTVGSRKLTDLCLHFGIVLTGAHSAQGDAIAAAGLLTQYIARLGGPGKATLAELRVKGDPVPSADWPQIRPSGRAYEREMVVREKQLEPCYIAQLVAKLPAATAATPEMEEYMALLDRILEDRRVTAEELQELIRYAAEGDMSREHAVQAHRAYLRDLVRAALEDGIITDSERKDLDEVRALLGVFDSEFASILAQEVRNKSSSPHAIPQTRDRASQMSGKRICFTGTFSCGIGGKRATRSVAEQIARQNGMIVEPRVSKSLDFLVATDPDSTSGKAGTARKYGVRIIAEPVFWRLMGIDYE